MLIKQKGLSVAINTFTGDITLRYVFPIQQRYMAQFKSVAQAYNIVVDTYRGRKSQRTQCVYVITAPSNVAFTTFRIIQKQLMILNRECKIDTLKQEVAGLVNEPIQL